jgi:hypothetical protein
VGFVSQLKRQVHDKHVKDAAVSGRRNDREKFKGMNDLIKLTSADQEKKKVTPWFNF